MKKNFLTLLLFFIAFSALGQFAITPSPVTVETGGKVTITSSGETFAYNVDHITFKRIETSSPAPGLQQYLNLTALTQDQAYDHLYLKPSIFSFSITNSIPNSVDMTARIVFTYFMKNKHYPNDPLMNEERFVEITIKAKQPTVYKNDAQSGVFKKNNCGVGMAGAPYTYTVAADTYTSTVSKDAANELARADVRDNGQARANQNGQCLQLYYNTVQSGNFYSNACADYGGAGGLYVYTVPAGKHSTTVSQLAANQLAIDDVNTNGQFQADNNGPCLSAFKIQVDGSLNVGNNANASLVFKGLTPPGLQYEFQLTTPNTSIINFGPQTRNLIRYTYTEAGEYQLAARTISPNGEESVWIRVIYSVQ